MRRLSRYREIKQLFTYLGNRKWRQMVSHSSSREPSATIKLVGAEMGLALEKPGEDTLRYGSKLGEDQYSRNPILGIGWITASFKVVGKRARKMKGA